MAKLILIGNGSVGKTSLRRQFIGDTVPKKYIMTMGAEFSIVREKEVILQIYDLAGQVNFKLVRENYYRNSQGAILVFDVSNRSSFDSLHSWFHELISNVDQDIPIIVVGNKIDLRDQVSNCVSYREGSEWVEYLRKGYDESIIYIETSVVERIKVFEVFNAMVQKITNGNFPTFEREETMIQEEVSQEKDQFATSVAADETIYTQQSDQILVNTVVSEKKTSDGNIVSTIEYHSELSTSDGNNSSGNNKILRQKMGSAEPIRENLLKSENEEKYISNVTTQKSEISDFNEQPIQTDDQQINNQHGRSDQFLEDSDQDLSEEDTLNENRSQTKSLKKKSWKFRD